MSEKHYFVLSGHHLVQKGYPCPEGTHGGAMKPVNSNSITSRIKVIHSGKESPEMLWVPQPEEIFMKTFFVI